MSEFNNRIDLQREVIQIVNKGKCNSQITGLSSKAIDRWILDNKIDNESILVNLLKEISSKLFFLANKSQEQITESYKTLSVEVSNLVKELKMVMIEK